MRVILEKAEIVQILGKHFDSEFDPEKVVIRTEPVFEIELRDIPMAIETTKPTVTEKELVAARQGVVVKEGPVLDSGRNAAEETGEAELFRARAHGANATLDAPEPGSDGFEGGAGAESLHAFTQVSAQLQAELASKHPSLYNKEPRRSDGSARTPTTSFNEEIS